MFDSDLFKPGNIVFIVVVSLAAIVVWNIVARKFSIFQPPAARPASVQQYPN